MAIWDIDRKVGSHSPKPSTQQSAGGRWSGCQDTNRSCLLDDSGETYNMP
jgi:hypothetical protein